MSKFLFIILTLVALIAYHAEQSKIAPKIIYKPTVIQEPCTGYKSSIQKLTEFSRELQTSPEIDIDTHTDLL